MGEEEERITVAPMLLFRLREMLIDYFEALASGIVSTDFYRREIAGISVGRINASSWSPSRVVVVDGGSNVVSMNAGFLGVCSAVAVVFEGNRVSGRIIGEPELVPDSPRDLVVFEVLDQVMCVLDKLREAKVFETALRALEEFDPELLVIDGPLMPYGALAKMPTGTLYEKQAFTRYKRSVLRLLGEAEARGVSVIGFVKRPRSAFLHHEGVIDEKIYDHMFLTGVLSVGEYCPCPPRRIPVSEELIHDREVLELAGRTGLSYTFARFTEATAPYRIDFGPLEAGYEDILSYLYSNRTREGIPYHVMKADEETKISRKLMRELYEDALHAYIKRVLGGAGGRVSSIVPALLRYGEW